MLYTYLLLFFIYSIIGWIMEVIFTLFTEKKLINRGFLLGPYCPIYGFGVIFLVLSLSKYKTDTWLLLGMTFLICSLIEYITSWLMEKIFKMRWWDYTHMKFNINGRICLETMLPFTVIGVSVIKYINPYLLNLLNISQNQVKIILSIILLLIFTIDTTISTNLIFNLKQATKNIRKDSTEEIRKAIHKFTKNNFLLYDRIVNAFPKMSKIIKNKKSRK